jgi:phosphatidylserine/phosphatidylglycerophosphate/cardiolipin synthase-like enzyme/DNA/RNA endonuclease YhcR with UshA esterase domain
MYPHKLILAMSLSLWNLAISAQTIANIRQQPLNSTVTVRGVVTNDYELGKLRFIQDGTAGIALFAGAGTAAGFETNVGLGDSVEVTGTLVSFQGLLEISPVNSYTILATNQPLPAPKELLLNELSESYESQLVRINCVNFAGAGANFSTSGTYTITDVQGNEGEIYLGNQHPLLGSPQPVQTIKLTGILSQYNDFQLLPRSNNDLVSSSCLMFNQLPVATDLQTNSITLTWTTNFSSPSVLHYGSTQDLGSTSTSASSTNHSVTLNNLQPATLYWIQVVSVINNDTLRSPIRPFITRSNSSGEIKVYFNNSIDNQYIGGLQPAGTTTEACLNALLERINNAQQTIDVAMYNCTRTDLVNALKLAVARGVRVRYIAAEDAELTFPVVFGNMEALMHNKFMVVDLESVNDCWVMGGSMNWTNTNINNDYNNMLLVQDQSLARVYTLEFEEMWGSNTAQPGWDNQRFGAQKTDNTPHQLVIGGISVECYFSPSDQVTQQITRVIEEASIDVQFALLTFTKNEPGNELVLAQNVRNVNVRGLIENIDDPGSEFSYLMSQGVSVLAHPLPFTIHHKYMVKDALNTTSEGITPTVLTGSHNWTVTAETMNDENTLIIRSADIARLYRAEFEARYQSLVSTQTADSDVLWQISPNPSSGIALLSGPTLEPDAVIQIFDWSGRLVKQQQIEDNTLDISTLPDGTYWIKLLQAHEMAQFSVQKISR